MLRTSTAVALALADKYTAMELGRLPGGWVPDDDEDADEVILQELHDAYPDEVDEDHRAAVLGPWWWPGGPSLSTPSSRAAPWR